MLVKAENLLAFIDMIEDDIKGIIENHGNTLEVWNARAEAGAPLILDAEHIPLFHLFVLQRKIEVWRQFDFDIRRLKAAPDEQTTVKAELI